MSGWKSYTPRCDCVMLVHRRECNIVVLLIFPRPNRALRLESLAHQLPSTISAEAGGYSSVDHEAVINSALSFQLASACTLASFTAHLQQCGCRQIHNAHTMVTEDSINSPTHPTQGPRSWSSLPCTTTSSPCAFTSKIPWSSFTPLLPHLSRTLLLDGLWTFAAPRTHRSLPVWSAHDDSMANTEGGKSWIGRSRQGSFTLEESAHPEDSPGEEVGQRQKFKGKPHAGRCPQRPQHDAGQ